MAKEKSSDDSSNSAPDKSVEIFNKLKKQSRLHSLLAFIGIPLMMATIMAGVVGLVELKRSADSLIQEKPKSFSGIYKTKINAVRDRTAASYQQYFQQLEENSSITDSIRLGQIYQLGLAAEGDYVSLLTNYLQLNYELASRVKGSGEWYYYFKKSLEEAVDKAGKREAAMRALLQTPAI